MFESVRQYLDSAALQPAPVVETDGRAIILDLSAGSRMFDEPLGGIGVERLTALIDACASEAGTGFAFGRYGEDRDLYAGENFAGGNGSGRRSIHMGIDLFCAAGTRVHAPLDAEIAIIANNTAELDYGPLLVLRHRSPDGQAFFSLYGHLDLRSLAGLAVGRRVRAGAPVAAIGAPPENGNWPPHLHFQLILDLLGLDADFPGVAAPSQRDYWLALSPSPARFFPECDPAALQAVGRDPAAP